MDKVKDFLKGETYCVISTVSSSSASESAYVAFSENDKLEVTIGTSKKSRKFQNIISNPNVSIVFGFGGQTTLQYEGVARVLAGEELEKVAANHYQKHPGAVKYEKDPSQTYLLVQPVWARITKSGPVVLEEMRFDTK